MSLFAYHVSFSTWSSAAASLRLPGLDGIVALHGLPHVAALLADASVRRVLGVCVEVAQSPGASRSSTVPMRSQLQAHRCG